VQGSAVSQADLLGDPHHSTGSSSFEALLLDPEEGQLTFALAR
jgi:hypothetical protein